MSYVFLFSDNTCKGKKPSFLVLCIILLLFFAILLYLLCNYFFLSLIKLFIMLCCMFFSFSSSFLSPLIILVSVKNYPFCIKKPLFMRFYICQKPSVLENPLRCFGKSVTCKSSVLEYTLYTNPHEKPSFLPVLPISKTFRFRFEGMSKTVRFSSVSQ